MIVITANILTVAFGELFDQCSQPLISNIMVTYLFTISINTEIQRGVYAQGN